MPGGRGFGAKRRWLEVLRVRVQQEYADSFRFTETVEALDAPAVGIMRRKGLELHPRVTHGVQDTTAIDVQPDTNVHREARLEH